MGQLSLVYCDNCERHTPLLPSPSWPNGWISIAFPDRGSYAICSYQCLLEFCQRMTSGSLASLTPMQPVENPCPALEHCNFDRVPLHLRYEPEHPGSSAEVLHAALHSHPAEKE